MTKLKKQKIIIYSYIFTLLLITLFIPTNHVYFTSEKKIIDSIGYDVLWKTKDTIKVNGFDVFLELNFTRYIVEFLVLSIIFMLLYLLVSKDNTTN